MWRVYHYTLDLVDNTKISSNMCGVSLSLGSRLTSYFVVGWADLVCGLMGVFCVRVFFA